MLDILVLLPQLFTTGPLLLKILSGKATDAEWEQATKEIVSLLQQIPVLKGFIAIFTVCVPVLKALLKLKDDLTVKQMLAYENVNDRDLEVVNALVKLLDEVQETAKNEGVANMEAVASMSPADVLAQV